MWGSDRSEFIGCKITYEVEYRKVKGLWPFGHDDWYSDSVSKGVRILEIGNPIPGSIAIPYDPFQLIVLCPLHPSADSAIGSGKGIATEATEIKEVRERKHNEVIGSEAQERRIEGNHEDTKSQSFSS